MLEVLNDRREEVERDPVSIVGITGTPGVGKSTVAKKLEELGFSVYRVNELAEKFGCIIDREEGCAVVDLEKLRRIRDELKSTGEEVIFVEGHLSHHLADMAIVLRCNPLVLKERLEERLERGEGWSEEKIMENVEAELVDDVLIEAMDVCGEVYEIDTTDRSVDEVVSAILGIVSGKDREMYLPGKVDWISEVGDRIDEVMRRF